MKKNILSLITISVVSLAASFAEAQTWNLANDFSLAGQGGLATGIGPNGVWSYGAASANAAFTQYMSYSTASGFGLGGLNAWQLAPNNVPCVTKNNTGGPISFIPNGAVMVNPGLDGITGPDSSHVVIWWTAPSAGTYSFNLNWNFPDSNADGLVASVTRDMNGGGTTGTLLQYWDLTTANRTASWTSTLDLAAGENMAFAVRANVPANYGAANTLVDLNVTAVPEPSSLALLGGGALLLLLGKRRMA